MENKSKKNNDEHWNTFYNSAQVNELKPPSQFGVFVINEIPENCLIVDVGCGNGRDSLFFSKHNYPVIGLDSSNVAIEFCKENAKQNNLNAEFLLHNIGDKSVFEEMKKTTKFIKATNILVYSRFFLHAINEKEEDALFEFVRSISKTHKTIFALEYRTHRDATMPKATDKHFRRFINPTEFVAKSIKLGFEVEYLIEGFGMAKYKLDDAHVSRCILSAI